MKYLIFPIFLSLSLAIQIMHFSGNVSHFSKMNSGTYLTKNHRMLDHNIASISFIHLPSNILYSEFFGEFTLKGLLIAPRLGIIDYGTLSSISGDDFRPYESLVEVTVHKYIQDTRYSGSLGYVTSTISDYKSSLLLYNFGVSQSMFNNTLDINLSSENNTTIINQYSNFMNQYFSHQRLNIEYILKYLPLNVFMDLLHSKDILEITFGAQVFINDVCNLYGAKKFYLSDGEYSIFDNISTGLSISNDRFQFNFGVQFLSAFNISYGTSLLMKFK